MSEPTGIQRLVEELKSELATANEYVEASEKAEHETIAMYQDVMAQLATAQAKVLYVEKRIEEAQAAVWEQVKRIIEDQSLHVPGSTPLDGAELRGLLLLKVKQQAQQVCGCQHEWGMIHSEPMDQETAKEIQSWQAREGK